MKEGDCNDTTSSSKCPSCVVAQSPVSNYLPSPALRTSASSDKSSQPFAISSSSPHDELVRCANCRKVVQGRTSRERCSGCYNWLRKKGSDKPESAFDDSLYTRGLPFHPKSRSAALIPASSTLHLRHALHAPASTSSSATEHIQSTVIGSPAKPFFSRSSMSMSRPECCNCGSKRGNHAKGRCSACYVWWKSKGVDKPIAPEKTESTSRPECCNCGSKRGNHAKGRCGPCYAWWKSKGVDKPIAPEKNERSTTPGSETVHDSGEPAVMTLLPQTQVLSSKRERGKQDDYTTSPPKRVKRHASTLPNSDEEDQSEADEAFPSSSESDADDDVSASAESDQMSSIDTPACKNCKKMIFPGRPCLGWCQKCYRYQLRNKKDRPSSLWDDELYATGRERWRRSAAKRARNTQAKSPDDQSGAELSDDRHDTIEADVGMLPAKCPTCSNCSKLVFPGRPRGERCNACYKYQQRNGIPRPVALFRPGKTSLGRVVKGSKHVTMSKKRKHSITEVNVEDKEEHLESNSLTLPRLIPTAVTIESEKDIAAFSGALRRLSPCMGPAVALKLWKKGVREVDDLPQLQQRDLNDLLGVHRSVTSVQYFGFAH